MLSPTSGSSRSRELTPFDEQRRKKKPGRMYLRQLDWTGAATSAQDPATPAWRQGRHGQWAATGSHDHDRGGRPGQAEDDIDVRPDLKEAREDAIFNQADASDAVSCSRGARSAVLLQTRIGSWW